MTDVAEFWIRRFLYCNFALQDRNGTQMLAKAVRRAFDSAQENDLKDELFSAAMALRRRKKPITIGDFAHEYLSQEAGEKVCQGVDQDLLNSDFKIDRTVLESVLQFKNFRLDNGVWVSAPIDQIGRAVRVSNGRKRTLTCKGLVEEEIIRTRHA